MTSDTKVDESPEADKLDPARRMIVDFSVAFLDEQHEPDVRRRLGTLLANTPDDAVSELQNRLRTTGDSWGFHAPSALARAVNNVLGEITVAADPPVHGAHHLAACRDRQLVFVANHLSFSDANMLAHLLEVAGFSNVVDRLSVLVGPKVYLEIFRRFSSLCFGAIKLPQSTSRATGEAVMDRREVARLARVAMAAVDERIKAGDNLLIFVEGTRSRTAEMQPALAAVSRYLEAPGLTLMPVGLVGSEHLVPIGNERARRTDISVTLGQPIDCGALWKVAGKRRSTLMTIVGLAIAELLPARYRGVYAESPTLEPTQQLLKQLR